MISVIIPLYFNDLTLYQVIMRCLHSIPVQDVETVVVDDCSPFDIEDFQPGIDRWIRNAENLGYTKTVNIGLKEASGDILVIMNDDITLKPGQLDRFRDLPDGIYSPKTSEEGPGDKFGSIWGMNRATYEKLGPLNELLNDYFSDTEYYDRAKELGIPVVKWDDMVVEHVGGATYSTLEDKKIKYEHDFQNYRNI